MNKKKLGTAAILTTVVSALFAGSLFAAPIHPIDHIQWMQDKNYIFGTKDGLALDRPITLVEAIAMIARVQDAAQSVKTADPAIKHWAAKPLTWAKQEGDRRCGAMERASSSGYGGDAPERGGKSRVTSRTGRKDGDPRPGFSRRSATRLRRMSRSDIRTICMAMFSKMPR
ncbi:hypothetical protein WDD9_002133 [Paenibacillus melissococcoides]|nr:MULTISPECIES: hypothetical protein [Paenibacillus]MEB9893574.1 hypothetical protein [Bacillus cereus]GIO80638.1 hypothetical protein J6TS7_42480 [Paenibacillus dendritiformis]CAH8709075.1 hypothetical protein WDD9_002133 [Paenibacillus melissococcoides]CAH8709830.1 hypothetical protein HTL2_002421 [Paenibacillus melissococcoides]